MLVTVWRGNARAREANAAGRYASWAVVSHCRPRPRSRDPRVVAFVDHLAPGSQDLIVCADDRGEYRLLNASGVPVLVGLRTAGDAIDLAITIAAAGAGRAWIYLQNARVVMRNPRRRGGVEA